MLEAPRLTLVHFPIHTTLASTPPPSYAMSDDGYGGGAGGDDYDYGGPSFAEDAFVRPYIMFLSTPSISSLVLV